MGDDEIHSRQSEIFDPFDKAIQQGLDRFPRKAAFSIHSFTPQMQGQRPRPWHAGFLTRSDEPTGIALLDNIQMQKPNLTLALNQPYVIEDESDWFIPQYAESNKLKHCLIEVRNDQLLDNNGIDIWASLLATAIESVMETVA
jgi:predicted N-formylglutamate amidohydrolase